MRNVHSQNIGTQQKNQFSYLFFLETNRRTGSISNSNFNGHKYVYDAFVYTPHPLLLTHISPYKPHNFSRRYAHTRGFPDMVFAPH